MEAEIGRIGGACPACGEALAPDDWFCRSCGAVVKRRVGRPRHLRDAVSGRFGAGAGSGLGSWSRSRAAVRASAAREHYEAGSGS